MSDLPIGEKFRCILADPPWPLTMSGRRRRAKEAIRPTSLPYPTMAIDELCAMPVADLSEDGCHLWLWTTNQHLRDGFSVMEAWGFKYLMPIHWIKPSGVGCWFIHRTQTILFGYRRRCQFNRARYRPNVIIPGCDPVRHSQKPEAVHELIESVSDAPRIELFARTNRNGWQVWGNEVASIA